MAQDERVKSMIADHYGRNDPLGWFETLYADAKGKTDSIPWADQKPNPHLLAWLDRQRISGNGRRAAVVGCGLGDDANELAQRGFQVTGFDIAPSAIEWARRRFAQSGVEYVAADLFKLPSEWRGAFAFVFEAYTIQALPRSLRESAIGCVAGLVQSGGELLVVCRGREDDEDEGSLPWPLSHAEMGQFERHGLRQISFENFFDDRDPPVRRFRALFRK